MTIQLDGYRVGRTQSLEDLGSTLGTSLGATVDQIWIENPSSSISRVNELDNAMNETVLTDEIGEPVGPLADMGADFPPRPDFTYKDQQRKGISKKDADKKVSEAGVKLDIGENGIPEPALNILIQRKREEVKRQALIDSAPSGFWSGAAQIGTGLAVSIADPLNVASAFVPIIGQARYAKLLANAGGAGGRAATRAGVGAVEGVVGAAIVEPIVLLAATAEQADYGLYDSYMNLAFGAVLGGGLHSGLGAIGDVIAKSSPATKESLLKSAVGQAMDDQPIDVGYVANTDPGYKKQSTNNSVDGIYSSVLDIERARSGIEITTTPQDRSLIEVTLPKGKEGANRFREIKKTDKSAKIVSKNEDGTITVSHKEEYTPRKSSSDDLLFDFNPHELNITEASFKNIDTFRGDVNAPVAVTRIDGEYFILDGHHRTKIKQRDNEAISSYIIPNSEVKRMREAGLNQADMLNVWLKDIKATVKSRSSIDANAPKIDAKSPEASPIASKQAQETIDNKLDETPETIDTLTNDIMTALDESGLDSVAIRAEIDGINKTADQDAAGLREALMCMIGK